MRFPSPLTIGLGLIIGGCIVLILNNDADAIFGLQPHQLAQLVVLLALLLFIGRGIWRGSWRGNWGGKFGGGGQAFKALGIWLGLIGVVAIVLSFRHEAVLVAGRVVSTIAPGSQLAQSLSYSGRSLRISRSRGGEFYVNAVVNDTDIALVFDTGADITTLTEADARRIGIDFSRLIFVVEVYTANGRTQMASTWVEQFRVGDFQVNDMRVLVAREGALTTNLLGSNFMRRLAGFEQRGDELILSY